MKQSNYLKKVKEQYENFPYPERNPDDEHHRLIATETECLDKLNHYCFEGSKNFNENFRVLVAGGGTGDAVIFLAEQLKNFGADVIYLDMTNDSMNIAKQRADIRGLKNIEWHTASLLDVGTLGIGEFDYINCSGVLHHLSDPAAGLAALNSVLKHDGVMSILVYARYGREGIYQIQDLMRRINKNEPDMDKCVNNCQRILNELPATHALNHTLKLCPNWNYQEPIELYDLFLHSQDRAYTVPQLYEYIENEGLKILRFLGGASSLGNKLYDPESYTNDESILKIVESMQPPERQATAELMNGLIPKHTVYVAKYNKEPADISNINVIPYFNLHVRSEEYYSLYEHVCRSPELVKLQKGKSKKITYLVKTELTEFIFKYLDGNKTLNAIYKLIMKDKNAPNTSIEQLQSEFENIFKAMNVHDFMYVRDSTVERPPTIHQLATKK